MVADQIASAFRDLGPKFEEPRPIQRQLLSQMLENGTDTDCSFLELPTGTGKSALGLALGKLIGAKQTVALTATKSLQDQYLRDFPQAVVVKGRGNYPCEANGLTAAEGVCTIQRGRRCGSAYYQAQTEAKSASQVISNYALYLSELFHTNRWWDRKPGLLICDEAHRLLDVLTQFETVRLDAGLAARLRFRVNGWPSLEGAQEWAKEEADRINTGLLASIEGGEKSARAWSTLNRQIQAVLELDPDDPNLITMKTGQVVEVSPLWPQKSAKALFRSAHSVLLMSATLYGGHVLAKLLGKDTGYVYYTAPSPFPIERWPVYYRPVARMSKAAGDGVWVRMSEAVHEFVHGRHQEKGVIHVSAANQVERVLHGCRQCTECQARVMAPGSGTSAREDRAGLLQAFRDAAPGTWLCHYSVGEGEDFFDDLARIQLIAKVPYPDLGDKLTRLRREEPGLGAKVYAAITAGKIAQTAGRGMRHERDFCETYILDGAFGRLYHWHRELFPPWFDSLLQ